MKSQTQCRYISITEFFIFKIMFSLDIIKRGELDMLIKNGLMFSLKEKGFVKKDILVEGSKIKLISENIEGDLL